MKTLRLTILLLFLSTTLFAIDKNYAVNFYNVNTYNQSIPAISLAIKPQKNQGLQFILSYVSTLLSFEKTVAYANNEDYSNLQLTLTYRF